MAQVISKIVTYKNTELTIDNNKNGIWTIGDAINKQIMEALDKHEQLQQTLVEFTDDEWFAMQRAHDQQQMPNAYERSQGIGTAVPNNKYWNDRDAEYNAAINKEKADAAKRAAQLEAAHAVPVVAPNASALPTTNKVKAVKVSGFGRYYLLEADSLEHTGPFDSSAQAQAYGVKKGWTFQVVRHSEISDSDRQYAHKPDNNK